MEIASSGVHLILKSLSGKNLIAIITLNLNVFDAFIAVLFQAFCAIYIYICVVNKRAGMECV